MWCMAHPYMTFFIAMLGLSVVNNIANNIIRLIAILNDKKIKEMENDEIKVNVT